CPRSLRRTSLGRRSGCVPAAARAGSSPRVAYQECYPAGQRFTRASIQHSDEHGLGSSLVELRAEALVEEPAEQQDGADRPERQGPLRRAQARQVEEEDLAEADPEENEAADAQQAASLAQARVQGDQREEAPEGAHYSLAALEVRVHVLRRQPLCRFEN